jgi:hypothetical protein
MVFRTHLPWRKWRLAAVAIVRVLLLAALAGWALDLTVGLPGIRRSAEVVVLVDRSASVSAQGQATADQWIAHARSGLGDSRVTVIETGRQHRGSSPLNEGILEAAAAFRSNGERRLLLLSDGMATTEDLSSAAAVLRERKVRLMAQPIDTLAGESLFADLSVPAAAWRSVPVPVEITLRSAAGGKSTITMSIDGKVADSRDVVLQRGQNVVEIPATFATEGTHLVEVQATFGTDIYDWDNSAAALVYVPLAPRVALLTGNTASSAGLKTYCGPTAFRCEPMMPRASPIASTATAWCLTTFRPNRWARPNSMQSRSSSPAAEELSLPAAQVPTRPGDIVVAHWSRLSPSSWSPRKSTFRTRWSSCWITPGR